MEQHKQHSSLILKYAKRRYDGGSEIELIRTIERKQMINHLNKLQSENSGLQAPGESPVKPEPAPEQVVTQISKEEVATARKNKALQALVLGPVQLCVGTVGIMTALLAIVTFKRLNNETLLQQGQTLLADCLKTFNKGLLDTVTTPVRVLKAATAKV